MLIFEGDNVEFRSYKYRRTDWLGRCTDKCKEQHLCRMVTQVHGDERYCEELMELFDEQYGRKNRFTAKNKKNKKKPENPRNRGKSRRKHLL